MSLPSMSQVASAMLNHPIQTLQAGRKASWKWVTGTNNLSHEWTENTTKYANSDEGVPVNDKIGIFVIGQSGSGKSSLCGLLSGDAEVKGISGQQSSGQRGTSEIRFIRSKFDENVLFIDTIGTKDNDTNVTDEQILKHALERAFAENVAKFKIIWCVSGDTKDRVGPFVREAKFVRTFDGVFAHNSDDEKKNDQDFASSSSVWKSVLIVKKEGKQKNPEKRLKGVILAATNNGGRNIIDTDVAAHAFGFTCTEPSWGFDVEDVSDSDYEEMPAEKKEQRGYLTGNKAKDELQKKLDALPVFIFDYAHCQCKRCGVTGDPRYVHAPCHYKSEWMHPRPPEKKHTGQKENYHPKKVVDVVENISMHHPGQKERKHSGEKNKVHTGTLKVAKVARTVTDIFSLSITWWMWSEAKWQYYTCCNDYIDKAKPCSERWTCCNRSASSEECGSSVRTWSCCGKGEKHQGCEELSVTTKRVYACCQQPEGHAGCDYFYKCCRTKEPCYEYRPCCDKQVKSETTYAQKANGAQPVTTTNDPPGCTQKCAYCRTNWGHGPGCYPTKN